MTERKNPSEFFIFEQATNHDQTRTETVAFASGGRLEAAHLADRLRAHHLEHMPPERIVLLGSAARNEELVSVARDNILEDSLPSLTRYGSPPPIEIVLFDERGRLTPVADGATVVANEETDRMLHTGLLRIFDERHGLLEAGQGFHWVNPSGRHTKAFIRAGNVLLHSAEVAFIAFGLLKWWQPNTRRIFTDTASINVVAYALVDLYREFHADFPAPTIDSFSSYGGLETFDFDERDAFCVISASTSGNLEREIVKGRLLAAERVTTLYYCGEKLNGPQILCDITDLRHPKIESFRSVEDCEMCRRGSATIHISGDQFLPADPEVQALIIEHEHAPRWLPTVVNNLLARDAVRCHASHDGVPEEVREIYLNLSEVVSDTEGPLAGTLRRLLLSAVPAATAKIVHLSDPSSQTLGSLVAELFSEHAHRDTKGLLVSETEARESPEMLTCASGTIIVVAGAVASGRSLLSLSQLLRTVEKGHLAYIVGIARLPQERDWQRLRSNLTFGSNPAEYPLMVGLTCELPASDPRIGSPWSRETQDLIAWRDLGLQQGWLDEEAAEQLNQRIAMIQDAERLDVLGLTRLFLPRISEGKLDVTSGPRLELRPGFVFWRNVDRALHPQPELRATDAEVHFTIASVLHHLRQPQPGGRALVQHEHNRTVLAPANFARFNDGIIQAAILRSALATELDYSDEEQLSAEMTDMLRRFAQRREEREGEALPEFLLALAQERLRLARHHALSFSAELEKIELPPLAAALASTFATHLKH